MDYYIVNNIGDVMARILYKIENKINGKIYIGQTKNFEKRMSAHKATNKSMVSKAIHKYGKENFKFEKLAILEDWMIDEAEQKAIKAYNSICPNGYNLDTGGCLQKEMSDEAKRRLSNSLKGRPSYRKGIKAKPESILKSISTKLRRELTPKEIDNFYKFGKIIEPKPKGVRIISAETREKARQAKLGRKQSPEHIEARRKGMIGHAVSEETRKKIAEANKRQDYSGRSTESSKRKQSETLKAKYANGEIPRKKKSKKRITNTSGFVGVYFDKRRCKYIAEIRCDGKRWHLGQFDSPEQAAWKYNQAAIELHKGLAVLNKIPGDIEEIARLACEKKPRPKPSKETIEKRRQKLIGQKRTPEQREMYSKAFKGRIISEEQRKNISNTLKGNIPWNKGVPMSEEQKEKLRIINSGRTSPMKGKTFSKEVRERMSLAHKGKPSPKKGTKMSEDQKQKISITKRLQSKNKKMMEGI